MPTEYPISSLPPEIIAHAINAERFGDTYTERILTQRMNTAQKLAYWSSKILGRAVGSFVHVPEPNSVTIIKRRSFNPSSFGETTYETRSGLSDQPIPGQLVFRIPYLEEPQDIRTQDQYPIEFTLQPDSGQAIDIPGLGPMGIQVRTAATMIPRSTRLDRDHPVPQNVMLAAVTYDGNVPQAIKSTLTTLTYNAWNGPKGLSNDPYYQEYLDRVLRNSNIARAMTQEKLDSDDSQTVEQLASGFQTMMNVFNVTAAALRTRIIAAAAAPQYNIFLADQLTAVDVIPSQSMIRFSDNLGQISEAQVTAAAKQMETAARIGTAAQYLAPIISQIIGDITTAYVQAQTIKSSHNS